MFWVSMPNSECFDAPRAGEPCIREGLERGKGLRTHHEQRFVRVQALYRFREVRWIDVRHEAERQVSLAVVLQRLESHQRSQIGATDAHVDDRTNRLTRVTLPLPAADLVAEGAHPLEHGVHFGHDVHAVDLDHGAPRRAQRRVQHRATFGHVDFVASKHRLHTLFDAGRARQPHEQLQRLPGNQVLRVIEVDARRLEREAVSTLGIQSKQLAQMGAG
jgi:hypothetical protein